jgi:hypothetical protein
MILALSDKMIEVESGFLQVNLRQLMHINLLYNASENNPTAVVSE